MTNHGFWYSNKVVFNPDLKNFLYFIAYEHNIYYSDLLKL
jgi:hypothetical protein